MERWKSFVKYIQIYREKYQDGGSTVYRDIEREISRWWQYSV
jgi:hypothetical protein